MSENTKFAKSTSNLAQKKKLNIDLNPPKKTRSSYEKQLSLEDYQDTIIAAFSSNGIHSSDILTDLYHKFKNIRTEIENVTPFPPIKIKNIIKHFKSNKKRKNDKLLKLKDFLSKTKVPEDEYEEDEQKIISLKLKKNNRVIPRKENDRFYMLPDHIKNLFVK